MASALTAILGQVPADAATEIVTPEVDWSAFMPLLVLIVGAVVLFVIFLTELSSNTATANLFVPIFFSCCINSWKNFLGDRTTPQFYTFVNILLTKLR